MTVETEFYDLVVGDATIAGVIGTRLYPVILPPEVTTPAATYRTVSARSEPIGTNMSPNDMEIRFQVDFWGDDITELDTCITAMRALFTQKESGGIIDTSIDLTFDTYDPDIKLYRRAIDVKVNYSG